MKKILRNSLLALATMAMASMANAATNFYILGEANGNSWAPNVGVQMEDDDEDDPGLYFSATVTFNGENSGYSYFSFTEKLGANASDWSGIASSRWGATANNFDLTSYIDEDDATIQKGENSFKIPAGTYEIYVDLEEKLVSVYAVEPEDPDAVHVYIIGTVDEMTWNPAEGTEMYNDEGDNVLYTAEGVVVENSGDGYGYFGFTTKLAEDENDWDAIASSRFGAVGSGDVEITEAQLGTELSLTKAGYQAFKLAAGTYDFTVNYSTMKLTVVKGEDTPDDPDEGGVYVMGTVDGNNWAANVGVAMEEGENEGEYSLACAVSDAGEGYGYFSFTTALAEGADDWDAIADKRFGAVSEGDFNLTDELLGQEISLTYENGQAIKAPAAEDYTIVVNLNTMKAVITRGETPEPPAEKVYVMGDVNNNHFAANVGVEMTADEEADDDVYTLTADFTNSSADDGFSYFSFTKALAENADDWDAIAADRFGAVSEGDFWLDDELLGQPISLTAENGQAIRAPQGNYSLSLNLTTMQLVITRNSLVPAPAAPTFSPAAGEYEESVSVAIAAEDGAAIRYTLDGNDPDRESALYAEPIVINEIGSHTVKAIAIKNGIASEIASAEYTIKEGGGSSEPKFEVIIESKDNIIASGDGRFSTGYGDYIYINDKANGKVVRYDKTGARSDYATVEGIGTGITSDDAGNILVNKGFPGATSATTWVIIKPDGTQQELNLTFPDAVTAARLDQAGRVVGDVMSSDGGYVFLTANGAQKLVAVKIANGEQVDAIDSPDAQFAFDTSTIAQPRYAAVDEIEAAADPSTAVVYRKRGALNVYGWSEDGSEIVDFGKSPKARSCEGFDIFTIGDKSYTVEPNTDTNYASGFSIRELGATETIVERGNELYAGGSQRFQSFTARVADGTAIIYRHVSGEGVSMYKFTPAGTGVESVAAAESEVIATTYYNLQGVRVMNPAAGQILVKVNTLSNGQIRASKVLVR